MPGEAALVAVLKARDEASAVFSQVEKAGSGFGSALGNIASTAAGFVVGSGLMALPGFLMDAAKAAAEDEQATARLSQTVKNLGGDYDGIMGSVNDAIAAGQKLAFSDDDVRDSFQFLANATGDTEEAFARQSAAMDLARGAHIPLSQATKMLGKMTEENVNTFKKLGIELPKNATEAEALAAVQAQFAGQADAYANSTAGQFEQAQIALSETKEALGAALLPALARVGQVLVAILPQLQDFAGVIGSGIGAAVNLALTVLDPFIDSLGDLHEHVGDLGDIFGDVFEGDVPGALATAQGFLSGFAGTLSVLVEGWGQAIADWVDNALPGLLGNLAALLIAVDGWIMTSGASLIEKLATWAAAFVDWVGPKIPDLLRELGAFLAGMVGWLAGTALPAIVTKLAEWAGAFVAWIAPRIPPMLLELGKLLLELGTWVVMTALPAIVSKLAEWGLAFVEWVGPRIVDLLFELGKLEFELGAWIITTALPAIVSKLAEWAGAFVEWLPPQIPLLLLKLGELEVALGTWLLTTALPSIIAKLAEWAAAFVAWVVPQIPPLLVALGQLLIDVGTWMITTALPALVSKLVEWGAAFLNWVAKDVLPTLPEKLGAILTAITGWVGEKVSGVIESVKSIGAGILTGIQNGISGALGAFWSWLQTNFVDKIPSFVRDLLNIHSPSGVFADIGRSLVDGLRVGMESRLPSIDDVIQSVVGKFSGMNGSVDDWLTAAMGIAGVPSSWMSGLKWLVGHESGGDPHAKNPNSTASGLFQLIDTTWTASRDRRLPNDIWNPIINAVAGIRYIAERYGNPSRAVDFWQSHGHYARGGWAGLHGPELAVLGEKGPEYVVPNNALGRSGGDTYNFYGTQPESVLDEAERRKRQRMLLQSARFS